MLQTSSADFFTFGSDNEHSRTGCCEPVTSLYGFLQDWYPISPTDYHHIHIEYIGLHRLQTLHRNFSGTTLPWHRITTQNVSSLIARRRCAVSIMLNPSDNWGHTYRFSLPNAFTDSVSSSQEKKYAHYLTLASWAGARIIQGLLSNWRLCHLVLH